MTKMLSAKAGGCFLCTLNAIFGKLPYTEKITKSASVILHILTRACGMECIAQVSGSG